MSFMRLRRCVDAAAKRKASNGSDLMAENTIALVSFVLTLMVFSYVLGDLPLIGILYRVRQSTFSWAWRPLLRWSSVTRE